MNDNYMEIRTQEVSINAKEYIKTFCDMRNCSASEMALLQMFVDFVPTQQAILVNDLVWRFNDYQESKEKMLETLAKKRSIYD